MSRQNQGEFQVLLCLRDSLDTAQYIKIHMGILGILLLFTVIHGCFIFLFGFVLEDVFRVEGHSVSDLRVS